MTATKETEMESENIEQGFELDQKILVEALQSKLAQAAVREAQLEAGIQQVILMRNQMAAELARYQEPSMPTETVSAIPDIPHAHQEE